MYQKFSSARDGTAARRAVLGMLAGIILIETCIALLAIAGRSLYPELADSTSVLGRAASETIILYLAKNALPAAAGAVLLAAAIAIVISSGSTMLLVPSTNVSRDLYERFINPTASEHRKVTLQRLSIVVFGGIGLLLLTQFESVLAMALYAYSVVGATLTPVLIAAFTWRRATAQGAVACIAGGLSTIVGLVIGDRLGVDFAVNIAGSSFDFAGSDYIVIPAVIISVGLLISVSLCTPRPADEAVSPFFDV